MRTVLLLITCCVVLFAHGQKNDYVWKTGYSSWGGYDSSFHYWFGISVFDFNQQPMVLSYDSLGINLTECSATISDNDGHVLFYSNGVSVHNYLDESLIDTMGGNWYLNTIPTWFYYGNPFSRVQMILPNPLLPNTYDIFLIWVDSTTNNLGGIAFKKLLRAQIDMGQNFGKGEANYKDKVIFTHKIAGSISAVKHGNGKDWWITTIRTGSNCYDVMYYDGTDNIRFNVQCGGSVYSGIEQYPVINFSPNGNYFANAIDKLGKLNVFDFNRCTGELNLIEQVDVPELRDSMPNWWIGSVAFSPNSRYLYLCFGLRVFQYDMLANPIAASKQVVGVFQPGGPSPLNFYSSQLGPDGKIYIASNNTTYFMAVINNPDEAGAQCNFQNMVQVPSFIGGLPHYPNYRLGVLPGSACDTLGLGISPLSDNAGLRLFPNPANDWVTADYGFLDWSKSDMVLEIINGLGQTVLHQNLPRYSGLQHINVAQYATGVYQVFVRRSNSTEVVESGKFVKQ